MTVRLMSDGELSRLEVLRDMDQRRLTSEAAAQLLGFERRQVFRLLKTYRSEGATGLISKRRGRPSNRRKPEELRDKALAIIRERYWDFGPTPAFALGHAHIWCDVLTYSPIGRFSPAATAAGARWAQRRAGFSCLYRRRTRHPRCAAHAILRPDTAAAKPSSAAQPGLGSGADRSARRLGWIPLLATTRPDNPQNRHRQTPPAGAGMGA